MLRIKCKTSGISFGFNIDCKRENFDKRRFCQLYAIEARRLTAINLLNGCAGGFHEPDAVNAAVAALKDMDAVLVTCETVEIDIDAEEDKIANLELEAARHLHGQVFVPALESWQALTAQNIAHNSLHWEDMYSWCSDCCDDTAVVVGESSVFNTERRQKTDAFAKLGFRPAIRIPGVASPKVMEYALYINGQEKAVPQVGICCNTIYQSGQEIVFGPSTESSTVITWLRAHDDIYIADRVLLLCISYCALEKAGLINGLDLVWPGMEF